MKAIITGATKGIGRATAEVFAAHGFDLAICSRSEEDLKSCAKAIQHAHNVEVIFQQTDMRDTNQVKAFGRYVVDQWSTVDVLVNNAGIFLPGNVHEEDEGILEMMMETNLYSIYHLTRTVLPTMLSKASGHIFNICSVASILAYPNGGSYSVSKYALMGFNTVLREEMKDKGIKVTAVLPGATWTNSWAAAKDEFPRDRLMEANDIAKSIWGCYDLGDSAVVEEILIRPQLGDL